MKQSLELKLGQRLTMTPQLQQAIKLLQLSAIDLKTEIQEALEENPLLEEQDSGLDSESVDGEVFDTEDGYEDQAETSPERMKTKPLRAMRARSRNGANTLSPISQASVMKVVHQKSKTEVANPQP